MVPIGYRPILSHIMKYYAFFGHKEFVLCLGYGADVIKEYFLKYDECVSNDFVLAEGGRSITLLNTDIHDWKITFVDTGIAASIGQRLKKVERHIGADELFLANYTDGLTDLPLPEYLAHFTKHDKVAGFLSVTPRQSFHVVEAAPDGTVLRLEEFVQSGLASTPGISYLDDPSFSTFGRRKSCWRSPFSG